MFSRQHYQKFAEILKKMHGADQELLATELITMFRTDNPRFDAEKFAQASGLDGNTKLHNVIFAHESVVKEGTVSKALFDKAKHKGDVYCSHCAGTGKEPPHKKEDCFHCDGKGYLTLKDLKRLEKDRVRVEQSNPSMKLIPLLPVGTLNELGFHGGNPTPEDVDVLIDDFESEFDGAENAMDNVFDGMIEDASDAEFSEVASALRQQVTLFRKAIDAFRVNVQKIYNAKKKKLGGK